MTNIDPMQSYMGTNTVGTNYNTQEIPSAQDAGVQKPAVKPKTEENSLQETNFVEDEELTPQSAKNQVNQALKEKEESYDKQIKQYYLQIDQLRSQLESIKQQRYALIEKLSSGSSASEIQSEMSALDEQAKSINSNIDTIFLTILEMEGKLENVRTTAYNTLNEINALTGAAPASNVSNTSNNVIEPFTGKRTTSNPTATKLADAVISTIKTNGSTKGWCLRGVNKALNKVYGFGFSYNSAYQALGELQSRPEFEEITNQYPSKGDLKNLPAGAIVIWGKNNAHPHGHISIALGDGREASDHIANQYTNSGGGYHIFMPKDLS